MFSSLKPGIRTQDIRVLTQYIVLDFSHTVLSMTARSLTAPIYLSKKVTNCSFKF
uniref:Uncharacterized protein n=1 Tax=Anguilla anguilla TaxID=7936 RepID=A0A0E9PE55_ANGAN